MNKRTYTSMNDQITPDSSLIHQTRAMMKAELRGAHPPIRNKRGFKPAVVVVSLLLCLIIPISAYAITYHLDAAFLAFLKPNGDEQIQYLANGAYEVNKKVSNKKGTLEVRQVLGDEHLTYILLTFTAPKGTVLDAARYRFDPESTMLDIKGYHSSYSVGYQLIDDGNVNDNAITLAMTISSERSLQGKMVTLDFHNLCEAGPLPDRFKPAIEGRWKVSFPLYYKNMSTTYEINKPIAIEGHKVQLERISISPVSVNIEMTGSNMKKISENRGKRHQDVFDQYPVTLVHKDGSIFTTTDDNSSLFSSMNDGNRFTSTKSFNEVIDMTEVQSILVEGKEFILR